MIVSSLAVCAGDGIICAFQTLASHSRAIGYGSRRFAATHRRKAAWLNATGGALPSLATRWSMPFFSALVAYCLVDAAVQRTLGSGDSDCCNREFCACSANCLVGRAQIAGPHHPHVYLILLAGGSLTNCQPMLLQVSLLQLDPGLAEFVPCPFQ
jgi:hypothetical protein